MYFNVSFCHIYYMLVCLIVLDVFKQFDAIVIFILISLNEIQVQTIVSIVEQ